MYSLATVIVNVLQRVCVNATKVNGSLMKDL